jgi:hypothetical protein
MGVWHAVLVALLLLLLWTDHKYGKFCKKGRWRYSITYFSLAAIVLPPLATVIFG